MDKFAILAIVMLIMAVGLVLADDPVPATSETQGISTSTAVNVLGSMTEEDSVSWITSSKDLRDNPPLDEWYEEELYEVWLTFYPNHQPPFDIEFDRKSVDSEPERQATMSYTETTLSDNGYSEYDAVTGLDTAAKTANQDNFAADRQLDFITSPDALGRLTTSESILLDGASQGSNATERLLCPFTHPSDDIIPAYCNVIEMGSSFSGSSVSMVTSAGERHIAASADVPVAMDYTTGLSGTGSAESHINAHIMEGKSAGWVELYQFLLDVDLEPLTLHAREYYKEYIEQHLAVDLTYSEKTTASGQIESFSKSMSYQSNVEKGSAGPKTVRRIIEFDIHLPKPT